MNNPRVDGERRRAKGERRRASLVTSVTMVLLSSLARAQTGPAQPLTLRQAMEKAMARSPEIARAGAQAAEAAADARSAEAAFAPELFATTTPGYSSGLPVAVAGRVPAVFGVELHKTIFDPVRSAQALEQDARAAAAAAGLATSTAATARDLVLAYGRNWGDQISVAGAREALEAREAIFRRVTALGREGRKTSLEVEQAGLDVARAKEPIAVSEDPLSALPSPPPGDNLAAARAADPQLTALDAETTRLERAARLQKRAWLPVVQAEGQYLRLANYNNFDQYFVKFKANDWALGVSVVVPLWTGGRLAHGQAAAAARLEKAHSDQAVRDRDLELAVRRSEADGIRAEARLALATRAQAVAREALRVAQALFIEGRGEPDDLDLRAIAAAQAGDDRAQASLGFLAARAKLLELRGELPGALLR
jgi:outer membrane protein TolC